MDGSGNQGRVALVLVAIVLLGMIAWYVLPDRTAGREETGSDSTAGAASYPESGIVSTPDAQSTERTAGEAGTEILPTTQQHPSIPAQITATTYSEMIPVSEAPGDAAGIGGSPREPQPRDSSNLVSAPPGSVATELPGPGASDPSIAHNDGPSADSLNLPEDTAGVVTGPGHSEGDESILAPESVESPQPLPGPGEGPQGPPSPGPGAEDPNTPPPS